MYSLDIRKVPKDFEEPAQKNNDEIEAFYRDVVFRNKDSNFSLLADWIEQKIVRLPVKNRMIISAQNYVLAPLVKHTSLASLLVAAASSETKTLKPNILHIWSLINKVNDAVIQEHQEQQLNSALEEEINLTTNRVGSDKSLPSLVEAREAAYNKIAERIIEKADFLMCIMPHKPSEALAQAIMNFVLDPMPLDSIKMNVASDIREVNALRSLL